MSGLRQPQLHHRQQAVPARENAGVVAILFEQGFGYIQEMLQRCREKVPGVAISSDFIVGFSGETEESFRRTCDLVREAGFKNSFIFKYSPRPGTKADELYPDDVPEEVKKRRNNDLLAIQNKVSLAEAKLGQGLTHLGDIDRTGLGLHLHAGAAFEVDSEPWPGPDERQRAHDRERERRHVSMVQGQRVHFRCDESNFGVACRSTNGCGPLFC